MSSQLFAVTRNTPALKKEIAEALARNDIATTFHNVNEAYRNHMTQCGADTDMQDALAATFGETMEDYLP